MALDLDNMRGQVRSELRVAKSDLPDVLLLDYINNVQKEVAQMLGPVVAPILTKRIDLAGKADDIKEGASGSFTYNVTASTLSGFSALGINDYAGDEVVFWGTFTTIGTAVFKDTITSNTADTLTLDSTSRVGYDSTAGNVSAIIFATPAECDPGTTGMYLPEDCMTPLFLSDYTDPDAPEERINIIQVDDTEQFVSNEYWNAEMRAAIHVGDVIHLLLGDAGSYDFPSNLSLTYIRRPTNYVSAGDTAEVFEGRLPEEYWGIMRAGVLKLSAMHLRKNEDVAFQGEDMAMRIASIQSSWGMSESINRRDEVTT